MTPTTTRASFIRILLVLFLMGLIYITYFRPTPIILDTTIPNTPELGATTVYFQLENDTLLFPTQCVLAQWDMSNTRGVYINQAGVVAPDTRLLCHIPPFNGVIAHLRVILPDDTAIQYDFKVRILIYDPVFLGLCLLTITLIITGIWELRRSDALWMMISVMTTVGIIILISMALISIRHFLTTPPTVWDDALMFARYAHNLSQQGVWSWNIGEAPTFGMTELAYGWLVYLIWQVNSSLSPIQIVQYASTLFGMIWLGVLMIWLGSHSHWFWRRHKWYAQTVLAFCVMLVSLCAHTNLLHHFTSGMGTTTVLLYVTLYIIGMSLYIQHPNNLSTIIMGIFSGLGFIVRPDVMLFTIGVPIALWFFPTKTYTRQRAIGLGVTVMTTFIITLVVARLYFGVALPLPFFAKSGGIADAYFANQYVAVGIDQLGAYIYSNRYLILLIISGIVIHPKGFLRRLGALERGLLVGMMAYIGYYALFVIQIMPEYQRFYYPTLPILIWLAFIGVASASERLRGIIRLTWRFLAVSIRQSIIVGVMVGTSLMLSTTIHQTHQFLYTHQHTYYPPYDARWYKLAEFADIDDLTVATTEVGAVGVANFSWRVIDLAGLNDTNFALNGFSADTLLNDYRPDLIYLPYPDYVQMIESIVIHPIFVRDYTYFTAGQLRLPMGVAIRKDSSHYTDLLKIARP